MPQTVLCLINSAEFILSKGFLLMSRKDVLMTWTQDGKKLGVQDDVNDLDLSVSRIWLSSAERGRWGGSGLVGRNQGPVQKPLNSRFQVHTCQFAVCCCNKVPKKCIKNGDLCWHMVLESKIMVPTSDKSVVGLHLMVEVWALAGTHYRQTQHENWGSHNNWLLQELTPERKRSMSLNDPSTCYSSQLPT